MNLYWRHERARKTGLWTEGGSFIRALHAALAGMSFPKSPAIERDWQALVRQLRSATQAGQSVIAFDY
jgi:hypothetical protein